MCPPTREQLKAACVQHCAATAALQPGVVSIAAAVPAPRISPAATAIDGAEGARETASSSSHKRDF
jgi:hypothetical protein